MERNGGRSDRDRQEDEGRAPDDVDRHEGEPDPRAVPGGHVLSMPIAVDQLVEFCGASISLADRYPEAGEAPERLGCLVRAKRIERLDALASLVPSLVELFLALANLLLRLTLLLAQLVVGELASVSLILPSTLSRMPSSTRETPSSRFEPSGFPRYAGRKPLRSYAWTRGAARRQVGAADPGSPASRSPTAATSAASTACRRGGLRPRLSVPPPRRTPDLRGDRAPRPDVRLPGRREDPHHGRGTAAAPRSSRPCWRCSPRSRVST